MITSSRLSSGKTPWVALYRNISYMNAHKYTHWNGEISLELDGSLFVREQQNRVKCVWQRSLCEGRKKWAHVRYEWMNGYCNEALRSVTVTVYVVCESVWRWLDGITQGDGKRTEVCQHSVFDSRLHACLIASPVSALRTSEDKPELGRLRTDFSKICAKWRRRRCTDGCEPKT